MSPKTVKILAMLGKAAATVGTQFVMDYFADKALDKKVTDKVMEAFTKFNKS